MRGATYAIVGDRINPGDGRGPRRVERCDVSTLPPELAGEGLIALGTMRIIPEGGGEVVALLVAVDHGTVLTPTTRAKRMAVYYDRTSRELRVLHVEVRP